MKATRLIVVLALLFAACGSSTEANEAAVGQTATATANDKLVGEFQTVTGETVDFASLQGSDLVVWFWAPW